MEAAAYYDTAGAAAYVAGLDSLHDAAIASKLAAQAYGLSILGRNIANKTNNQTRFYIITLEHPKLQSAPVYKTSLILSLSHTPNALAKVLSYLGEYGFNLTKITSRPNQEQHWHYQFLVEFTFEDKRFAEQPQALQHIAPLCEQLRVLGTYPASIF